MIQVFERSGPPHRWTVDRPDDLNAIQDITSADLYCTAFVISTRETQTLMSANPIRWGRNTGEVGEQGDQGPEGPQGQRGDQGERGLVGPRGERGEKGDRGPRGHQGNTGNRGKQGPPGEQGRRGPEGKPGDKGERGPVGPDGRVGPEGPPGADGDQGPRGYQGDPGPEGPEGPRGERGEQGERGIKGDPGEQGDQGYNGPHGPIGIRGERGKPGGVGPVGLVGPQGDRGPTGEKGAPGEKGDPGLSLVDRLDVRKLSDKDDSVSIASKGTTGAAKQAVTISSSDSSAIGRHTSILSSRDSKATGEHATVVSSSGSVASGRLSTIIASKDSKVSGTKGAVIASEKSSAAHESSIVLASKGVSTSEDYTVVMGHGEGENDRRNTKVKWDAKNGQMILNGSAHFSATGFGEYFENRRAAEFPLFSMMTIDAGGLRLATDADQYIIGVTVPDCAVVANAFDIHWHGMYKTNDDGTYVTEPDGRGNKLRVLSDAYDPTKIYVPRSKRPREWTLLALTGQMIVKTMANIPSGKRVSPSGKVSDNPIHPVVISMLEAPAGPGKPGVARCTFF